MSVYVFLTGEMEIKGGATGLKRPVSKQFVVCDANVSAHASHQSSKNEDPENLHNSVSW